MPAASIHTKGTQKIASAAASARSRRARGTGARRVISSSPHPASSARQNRTRNTSRPLWAVLNPGSAVTSEKIGSTPTTTASANAAATAKPTRRAAGRRIRPTTASISVMPPA